MKSATVIRHVHFEDLGSLASVLSDHAYEVTTRSVGDAGFLDFDPTEPDLLVILGGPIGAYEEASYPFLETEKDRIRTRLADCLPTIGICLGAQMIAAACGSRVYPSGVKEIGFSTLTISDHGMAGPLRHLDGIPVLHWHGDTYDLPDGAQHLASTGLVYQQAFALGHHVLGMQFHAEVDGGTGFERWLVGHASELAAAKVDIIALRSDAEKNGHALVQASRQMLNDWLRSVPAR
jgi:GMP synthase (glutamine-hydrolysing)